VARFSFAQLCEQPLGANDFLHIAHAFHTVLIDGIPTSRPDGAIVTRRFVNLIDTLYDNACASSPRLPPSPMRSYPAGDMLVPVRAHLPPACSRCDRRVISRAASTGFLPATSA
jgi:hypothetical protein